MTIGASIRAVTPALPAADQEVQRIHMAWLVRLRWGAVLGQLLTIVIVDRIVQIALPLPPLLALVTIEGLSNLALLRWARRGRAVRPRALCLPLGFDVVLLTLLLMLTGGPFNPFSFLYLVHIALAAVVLPAPMTWYLVGLSLGCFALLFVDQSVVPAPPHLNHTAHFPGQMRMHMQGMWCAFAVAATFISYFVARMRRSLGQREAELAQARAQAQQSEKLASLAALAASAGRELSAPLAAIAARAQALQQALRAEPAQSDAGLIRREVERCREILRHMTAHAGTTPEDAHGTLSVLQLLAAAIEGLPQGQNIRVSYGGSAQLILAVPPQATVQALRGVLKNALQASVKVGRADVEVEARVETGRCRIDVRDRGAGMTIDVLARAGEPFFTTKEPGEGMGLGLFLTRAVLERAGGQLRVESRPGAGTTATLLLPVATANALPRPA